MKNIEYTSVAVNDEERSQLPPTTLGFSPIYEINFRKHRNNFGTDTYINVCENLGYVYRRIHFGKYEHSTIALDVEEYCGF